MTYGIAAFKTVFSEGINSKIPIATENPGYPKFLSLEP
jgi:hypothetical protein